ATDKPYAAVTPAQAGDQETKSAGERVAPRLRGDERWRGPFEHSNERTFSALVPAERSEGGESIIPSPSMVHGVWVPARGDDTEKSPEWRSNHSPTTPAAFTIGAGPSTSLARNLAN